MLKLFDFTCSSCHHIFEELINGNETIAPCPLCDAFANKVDFSYSPTNEPDPRIKEIMQKGANIRNKLTGKVKWRKSSWSQSD
jgi:hypothetical protein